MRRRPSHRSTTASSEAGDPLPTSPPAPRQRMPCRSTATRCPAASRSPARGWAAGRAETAEGMRAAPSAPPSPPPATQAEGTRARVPGSAAPPRDAAAAAAASAAAAERRRRRQRAPSSIRPNPKSSSTRLQRATPPGPVRSCRHLPSTPTRASHRPRMGPPPVKRPTPATPSLPMEVPVWDSSSPSRAAALKPPPLLLRRSLLRHSRFVAPPAPMHLGQAGRKHARSPPTRAPSQGTMAGARKS
mmetsp:Transcript_46997/g.134446  ORF Transcript_46997/g.134446 Transcript_46997/m.134446 type:complete len:245 (-) Transcript_46997:1633-2367(-)